jgi:polyphosphate kinase
MPPPHSPYLNRDLSWLEFDRRVLAPAADASRPLLERVKFVAIFSNNLDEFFQVRVADLQDRADAQEIFLNAMRRRDEAPASERTATR